MFKGSREYLLNKILTTTHITLIVFAGMFAYLDGYPQVPFAYLLVFFINEYTFSVYSEGDQAKKEKISKWYMLSSASLIVWLVFLIFLPQINSESWSPTGSIWTTLYTTFVLIAAAVMIAINWVRKIATA